MARTPNYRFEIRDGRVGTATVRQVTPAVSVSGNESSNVSGRVSGGVSSNSKLPGSRGGNAPGEKQSGKGIRAGSGRPKGKPVGPLPQQLLTDAASVIWGARAVPDFDAGVEGRRFRIDLAFPEEWLAVEVDGWQYHGRMKGDFDRERERQNLLTLEGWRILRYPAGLIRADLDRVIRQIAAALDARGFKR